MTNYDVIKKLSSIRWELSELSKGIKNLDKRFADWCHEKNALLTSENLSYICSLITIAVDGINKEVKRDISELNDELNNERMQNE